MIPIVLWCNLCQKRPANAKLKCVMVKDGPVEIIDVCEPCIMNIPKEVWTDEYV